MCFYDCISTPVQLKWLNILEFTPSQAKHSCGVLSQWGVWVKADCVLKHGVDVLPKASGMPVLWGELMNAEVCLGHEGLFACHSSLGGY